MSFISNLCTLGLSDYSLLTPDDLDKMSRCYLEQIFCSQICHRRSKTCSSRPTHQNCNQLKDLSVIKGIFLWDKSLSLKSVHQYSEYTLRLSSDTPHCKKYLPRAPCPGCSGVTSTCDITIKRIRMIRV